ncbi:MAG: response regulator [Pseudomonadales bacterium]|nr:response regulator [Pseudomonadales bacterium]
MGKKSILIIDDNMMVIHALRVLLGEKKYKVYGAENGEAGIREYSRIKPDIVITDMEMPIMSGEKVIATIKDEHPFQVVLAMSSRASNEDIAILAGATKFISKPVMPEDVIPYIENILPR